MLTTALEVRSLTVAQASEGREAHLRGRVIFFERAAVFVQDATSTTFFRPRSLGALRLGDEVEVRGRTQPGLFLPGLGLAEFKILRRAAVPDAIPASYEDLVSARLHYQRVSVEGIVRSVASLEEGQSVLQLALGSRLLEVRVDAPVEPERAPVDSRVRVRGLAAGFINERRQLVQPYVRAQDWSEVTIREPAPPVAEVPAISAAELLAFRITGHARRRVRIRGVVTAAFPPGRVYLREENASFAAEVDAAAALRPGDRVELMGFPEMGGFSATLAHASVLRRESGPAPAPIEVTAEGLAGANDGELVRFTARLANAFRTEHGLTLVLQEGARTLQARAPEDAPDVEPGSRVRVTGICIAEDRRDSRGFNARAAVVSLRVRSAADIAVLSSPSWWTARRLGAVLAALSAVMLLALLWIAALRRQVARQTTALRHRIEAEAALEERQRIAREFHDTLEQELAGVSLRLDALATRELDEKGRQLITGSRNLVSRIQAETRDLIGDLRDAAETAGDLPAALTAVAVRQTTESGAQVRLECAEKIPPLPAATVHDLRMIARESVTNALKHGRATEVVIRVEFSPGELRLCVADNGSGFDPAEATLTKRGHFGCAGIRERARKIGATVAWHSASGKGTTVEVTWPIGGCERARGEGDWDRGRPRPHSSEAAGDGRGSRDAHARHHEDKPAVT